MREVDRLILRELFGPFLNSAFLFLSVLFATTGLFKITEYLTQGIPVLTVGKIVLFMMPLLITQTLPMSMLLGTLLAFGRISGDSEHIALFASGINFFRIVLPVIFMGLLVAVFTFLWNESVVPRSQREYLRLAAEVAVDTVTSGKPVFYTVKQPKTDQVDEFVNIAGGFDRKQNWFRKVSIFKMSDDPQRQGQYDFYVYADRARPQTKNPSGLSWYFEDVTMLYLKPLTNSWPVVTLKGATTEVISKQLGAEIGMRRTFTELLEQQKKDNHTMTFQELRDRIRKERAAGNLNTAGDEVDLWEKVSLPLASLIFGLVGAPLGIRPHRGSKAMGFGVAIGIIFLYWVVYRWMYVVGQSGGLPPIVASFTSCFLGLVAAAMLVARTRQ